MKYEWDATLASGKEEWESGREDDVEDKQGIDRGIIRDSLG